MLKYANEEGMQTPVALLIYHPKDLQRAAYIPFAEFSPEWQAVQYGLKNDTPIHCMDLPMNLSFALDKVEQESGQLKLDVSKEVSKEDEKFRRDPLAALAKLASYEDSERWWEVTFEQTENSSKIFTAILEMMIALRENVKNERPRTLQREAYMRKVLRKAVKEGYQNIAIVCGAWHAPVLQNWMQFKQSADNALLKGIKKISTKATWIPWTYDRLSMRSGYGAGIHSPAWYELLFSRKKEATIRWMVKVARLFRQKDLDASSAHAIEATRLAETLATLRGLSVPGIFELREAATSIFCGGDSSKMALIDEKLVVGDKMGKVPKSVPVIPLQQDLEKQIKSARLTRERNSSETINKELDLRTASNLTASYLLHRLNVLSIPWGKLKRNSQFAKGGFKEKWGLKWRATFALRIIEAGMWGNTVFEAANRFLVKTARETQQLSELSPMVEQALQANLTDAIEPLLKLLQDKSAVTTDVLQLMEAIPPLINIVRYGDTRSTDVAAVETVLEQIIPRICIGFPNACINLDDDAAQAVFDQIIQTNHALSVWNKGEYTEQWYRSLENMRVLSQVHLLLQGISTRLLFEKQLLEVDATANAMSLALSTGTEPGDAAQWLEGFLHGSGLLLIHQPILWRILDEWVAQISRENFNKILPLLRRTFSNFAAGEREQMLQLVKNKGVFVAEKELDYAGRTGS